MKRTIICIIMVILIVFTNTLVSAKLTYVNQSSTIKFSTPIEEDKTILYSQDGRSVSVDSNTVSEWKKVGWYCTKQEAENGFHFDDDFFNSITSQLHAYSKEKHGTKSHKARFSVDYINDDSIPDILLTHGKDYSDGVCVFIVKKDNLLQITDEYLLSDNKPEFGRYGQLEYIPKKGRIYFNYAGSASVPVFFDIQDNKATIVCSMYAWKYYYEIDGKQIGRQEYMDIYNAYYNNGVEYTTVSYDNMHEISCENIKEIYTEVLSSNKIKMYSSDGRTCETDISKIDTLKESGWYEYPVRTLYSLDGRSIVVAADTIPSWVNVGWHTEKYNYMFHPDAEMKEILLKDTAKWKSEGWYEYPVMRVYSLDGRSVVIDEQKFEEWKSVGWYSEHDAVNIYSKDGRVAKIYVSELNKYKKLGWYTTRQKSIEQMKKEVWRLTINDINDGLRVPGSGEFPPYNSNNIIYDETNNRFYVYMKITAKNMLGIRISSGLEYVIELTSSGYKILEEKII